MSAHGDDRVDDWYWVADRDDPAVLELLRAENAFTDSELAPLEPLLESIYDSIISRVQMTDVTCPTPKRAWAYYSRTIDGREHSILCRRPISAPPPDPNSPVGTDPDETVVLDENELAADAEYLWVASTALSPSQGLLAYAADLSGAELLTIRIRDIAAGRDLDDVIEGAYFSLAFAGDGALFYTRPDAAMRGYQVWRHVISEDVSSDGLVWEEGDERFELSVAATKDDAYVVLSSESTSTSECRLVPAGRPEAEPAGVLGRRQGVKYSVEHHAGELLVLSNEGGDNFELWSSAVAPSALDHRRLLVAHRADVRLETLDVVAGHAVVAERGHARTAIRIIPLAAGGADPQGRSPGTSRTPPGFVVSAPCAGAIALAGNLDFDTSDVTFEVSSLVAPPTTLAVDVSTATARVLHRLPVPSYEPGRYRTQLFRATSPDGTRVPLTLAWRRDRPDGPGPCLLYGYGAYEASSEPNWDAERPVHPLLDRGVVYAIAHVRGGGELGRSWYLDGRMDKKPNSFNDLVACARWLVEKGWTTPSQLAAEGRSAGGLLMGASANLAPELFAAVVAEVPFVDCVTTMLDPTIPLTVPEQEEWGDPVADARAYEWLKAYSPYDNVAPVRYPRMLVTTGLNDPRVMYSEPTKWVQKLRSAHPENPERILLRAELSSGHHGPSGRYQAWRQRALVLAFVLGAISGEALSPAVETAPRPDTWR